MHWGDRLAYLIAIRAAAKFTIAVASPAAAASTCETANVRIDQCRIPSQRPAQRSTASGRLPADLTPSTVQHDPSQRTSWYKGGLRLWHCLRHDIWQSRSGGAYRLSWADLGHRPNRRNSRDAECTDLDPSEDSLQLSWPLCQVFDSTNLLTPQKASEQSPSCRGMLLLRKWSIGSGSLRAESTIARSYWIWEWP